MASSGSRRDVLSFQHEPRRAQASCSQQPGLLRSPVPQGRCPVGTPQAAGAGPTFWAGCALTLMPFQTPPSDPSSGHRNRQPLPGPSHPGSGGCSWGGHSRGGGRTGVLGWGGECSCAPRPTPAGAEAVSFQLLPTPTFSCKTCPLLYCDINIYSVSTPCINAEPK